jgi:hypothetical protein
MIAMDVKVKAAGFTIMPAARSIASWIHSISSYSRFDCRNSIACPGTASRHIASTSASVVRP